MQENQPGKTDATANDRLYLNSGYGRNVGFIMPNGDCEAFNYSYLVRIRYVGNESAIYLYFTYCNVIIEGYNIAGLYLELFDHRSRFIECVDERYKELVDDGPIVTKVTVIENK